MGKKRIVIVDDCVILREALRLVLSSDTDFDVAGEAGDGEEAIQCVEKLMPHLVLIDLSIPKMMGWDVIREIKKRFPETKVLALTEYKRGDFILSTFRAGADGYALKESTYAELISAINDVLKGESYISPGISEEVIKGYLEGGKTLKSSTSWVSLTRREQQIIKLIAEGYKYKEIADYLCISPATVQKHRTNIGRKLNLHNIPALAALAVKKGIVTN